MYCRRERNNIKLALIFYNILNKPPLKQQKAFWTCFWNHASFLEFQIKVCARTFCLLLREYTRKLCYVLFFFENIILNLIKSYVYMILFALAASLCIFFIVERRLTLLSDVKCNGIQEWDVYNTILISCYNTYITCSYY